jgi:predicted GIY-YIG superfamily endonuclease
VKGLHEKISHLFKSSGMKIVGKAVCPSEANVFSNLKDTIEIGKQSNLVYNVNCPCGKNYVGQTSQYLATRFQQHVRDGKKDSTNGSALSQHMFNTGHEVAMENVSVLGRENVWKKRSILEMVKIKKARNCLNLKNDTESLPHIYDLFLNGTLMKK